MTDKQHHANQIEDAHEDTGHVEELKRNILLVRESNIPLTRLWRPNNLLESLVALEPRIEGNHSSVRLKASYKLD